MTHAFRGLLLALLCLSTRPALAADPKPTRAPRPATTLPTSTQRPWLTGWYAPSGILLGASLHGQRSNGFVIGVEQSLVYQRGPRASWWGGLHGEAAYDFGASWTRLSFGPEVGYGIVGLDGGFVRVLRNHEPDASGLQGRVLVTMGIAAVYGRLGVLYGSAEPERFGEVGLLLKWPWSITRPPASLPQ